MLNPVLALFVASSMVGLLVLGSLLLGPPTLFSRSLAYLLPILLEPFPRKMLLFSIGDLSL
jgi:hypothetical protein